MTLESKEEGLQLLERYRRQTMYYLENAAEMLGRGEWGKGAEMAWGALAEALKAVALAKGNKLNSHADMRRFARQLAKELQEDSIENAFVRGERLHSQFYEGFLDPEDVATDVEAIKRVLPRLLSLVPS